MESPIDLNQLFPQSELRVGLISDTHGSLNAEVVGTLHGCNIILHAGDIGSAAVIQELKEFTPHVYSVRGNNDVESKWPAEDLAELKIIPDSLQLVFESERIAMTHGHQYPVVETRHAKLREQFPQSTIVVYGHSHHLVCDQEYSPWVINPGAGGYNRTFDGPSCMVMHFKDRQWSIEHTFGEK